MSLPPGKTHDDALAQAAKWKSFLWSDRDWMAKPEDKRIEEFQAICLDLYGGDKRGARLLELGLPLNALNEAQHPASIVRNVA